MLAAYLGATMNLEAAILACTSAPPEIVRCGSLVLDQYEKTGRK
jgi:hypothetical protein